MYCYIIPNYNGVANPIKLINYGFFITINYTSKHFNILKVDKFILFESDVNFTPINNIIKTIFN